MVIQKCLARCSPEQRARLANKVVSDCLLLTQNQFGNYIIQNIIKMKDPDKNVRILKKFSPFLIDLCIQKFSSNVIEKCLENFDNASRNMLYGELEKTNVIKKIIVDNYGNYGKVNAFKPI